MGSLEPHGPPNLTLGTANSHSKWQADLSLTLAKTSRGTRLVEKSHTGPLYVQKPFYPEGGDIAHVYWLHPPGGIVSGDDLKIDVELKNQAQALLTTPGAGRVYKARADLSPQVQTVTLNIAQQSSLEWFPLETIVYPASNGVLKTVVSLPEDNSGRFIGWEITALGLPASRFPFSSGQLLQQFQLWQNNRPLLLETLRINAEDTRLTQGVCGLQGFTVSAFMLAGPFNAVDTENEQVLKVLQQLREATEQIPGLGITHKHQFIIVRLLESSAEQARQKLTKIWQILRPELLGVPATLPRIWAC